MKKQFIKVVMALGLCSSLVTSTFALEVRENKEWGLSTMEDEMSMEMESLDNQINEMDFFVDALTNPDDSAFLADGHDRHKKLKEICKKVNLDDKQKSELKNLVFSFMKDMISEKAKLKISIIDYIKLILDENAELAAAQTQSSAILSNFQSLGEKSANFKNTVLFQVLSGEQRKPAFVCALGIKKLMQKKKLARSCAASGTHRSHH